MPKQKTETEIYDLIMRADGIDWLLMCNLDFQMNRPKLYLHQRVRLGRILEYLYSESKKFRKPKREHIIDMFEKPKREHREFCTCEICMEKLDEYNKRNNTTYQTEFIW
jgi:hypothetical protein